MAASTPIILTAGGIALLDVLLGAPAEWAQRGLPITVGTVGGAFISAGLDKVLPGFGTGVAVVLLVAVLYSSGPKIAARIDPSGKGLTRVGN